MAGPNPGTPQPSEIKLHQKSRTLMRQDEMWQHYLKRLGEAGASREPQKT